MVRVSRWLIPTVVALTFLMASAGAVQAQVGCYPTRPRGAGGLLLRAGHELLRSCTGDELLRSRTGYELLRSGPGRYVLLSPPLPLSRRTTPRRPR